MHEDADQVAASSQSVSTTGTTRSNRLLPTNRLEAFSDGVFAIAITLLVLQLNVPPAKEGLLGELARQWLAYLGYFVSFAFIGGVWITHSSALRFIKSVDGALMRLNLLLLCSCRYSRSRQPLWRRTWRAPASAWAWCRTRRGIRPRRRCRGGTARVRERPPHEPHRARHRHAWRTPLANARDVRLFRHIVVLPH